MKVTLKFSKSQIEINTSRIMLRLLYINSYNVKQNSSLLKCTSQYIWGYLKYIRDGLVQTNATSYLTMYGRSNSIYNNDKIRGGIILTGISNCLCQIAQLKKL